MPGQISGGVASPPSPSNLKPLLTTFPQTINSSRTFFTAATVSCPVPLTLAEDPKYGPAYLEKRYTSVDFWYRYLKEGP